MSRWVLSAEQFAAAWFSTGLDRMPFPFRFVSQYPHLDEYEAFQRAYQTELAQPDNRALRGAIAVLAQPDWRLEVFGHNYRRSGGEIRAIGCATHRGAGVIAVQTPDDDGGPVRLVATRAERIAAGIVGTLPNRQPGSVGERQFLLDDLNDSRPDPFGRSRASRTKDAYNRFWRQPADTRGTITVLVGPRGSEAVRTGRLRWLDAADGRYYEVPANRALIVRPATAEAMTRVLDRAVQGTPSR